MTKQEKSKYTEWKRRIIDNEIASQNSLTVANGLLGSNGGYAGDWVTAILKAAASGDEKKLKQVAILALARENDRAQLEALYSLQLD